MQIIMATASKNVPETVNVWPTAFPGDAIIYDPRIMHRGRANVGEMDRPMLHNSYCHSWYSDQDNERGADALKHNMNKLGKVPEHIMEHMAKNGRVFSRLGLQHLIKKMYTLYAANEEDLKSSNLPIVEAVDGTSTSIEIEMRESGLQEWVYACSKFLGCILLEASVVYIYSNSNFFWFVSFGIIPINYDV